MRSVQLAKFTCIWDYFQLLVTFIHDVTDSITEIPNVGVQLLEWSLTLCLREWQYVHNGGERVEPTLFLPSRVNHRVLAEKCWQSHLSNWSTLYTKGSHRYTGVRKGLIQVCKAQERVNKGLLMVQKGCLKQCFFFFLNNLPSFQEYFFPASAQTGRWVLKSWPHRHSASRTGPSCIPCCTHSGRTPWCWGSGRSHRHLACWSTRQCLHKGKHSTADDIS